MSTEQNYRAQELTEKTSFLELQQYREELFLKFASAHPRLFFAEIFDKIKEKQQTLIQRFKNRPLEDLNVLTWQQQLKKAREQGLGENHARDLLHTDLKFFTKEYVLHQNRDQFSIDVVEENQATSLQYVQSNFREMAKNMLLYKGKEQKTAELPTRPEIEAAVFGDFLSTWLSDANPGEKLALLSPPGKKNDGYLGYESYSFLYIYETKIQNGKKTALAHSYRLWLNPQESSKLLKKLAKNPEQISTLEEAIRQAKFLNREQINHLIMLSATEVNTQLNLTEIEKILTPLEKKTPVDQRELEIDQNSFWQDFDELFDNFFWLNSKNIFAKETLHQKDVEELDRLRRFWENAIRNNHLFYQKETNSSVNISRITPEKLNQEYQTFLAYWKKEKNATPGEAQAFNLGLAALFQNVGGLGALQRGLSLGSCLGGTLPSLMLQGQSAGANLGLPLSVSGEIAKGYHCPLCHRSIADPCFCPNCSPALWQKSALPFQFGQSNSQAKKAFSQKQMSSLSKQNPYESESVTDFFANLIGPQRSLSFSAWMLED